MQALAAALVVRYRTVVRKMEVAVKAAWLAKPTAALGKVANVVQTVYRVTMTMTASVSQLTAEAVKIAEIGHATESITVEGYQGQTVGKLTMVGVSTTMYGMFRPRRSALRIAVAILYLTKQAILYPVYTSLTRTMTST